MNNKKPTTLHKRKPTPETLGNSREHSEESTGVFTIPPRKARISGLKTQFLEPKSIFT